MEKELETLLDVRNLDFFYGNSIALKQVTLPIMKNQITSLIGPSGCGKTTLLRCFNRMHDLYPGNRYQGEILMNNENILDKSVDLISLRSRLGMVFQKPTPFPMSVFDNIAYGLRLKGVKNMKLLKEKVEKSLEQAALLGEVKDRMKENAVGLSGGQQQRLVIARTLAVDPDVILFDESTSALDPISTQKIEDLMVELKKTVTIVAVTHNMQQAARISDFTALMYIGSLVEYDKTEVIFTKPKHKMTEEYVLGRFG
jgi:phosphate transport system ATP-binding protein